MMTLPTRRHFNPVAICGLLLYAISFTILLRNKNFEAGGALIVLVLFGIIFPALAWLATVRAVPLSISVHPTAREMLMLVACIAALSIYLIGGPQWLDNHLAQTWIDSPRLKFFITLAKKLIVFVLIPFGIFRLGFGYQLRDFGIQKEAMRALRGNHLPMVLIVGITLLVFQFFLGNAAAPIRQGKFSAWQLLIGLPLCFTWLVIEVGLVEEFFFRALLQSRLAAWFKSEVSGVVLMSLAFGLAHAPGFIFRGAGTVEGLGATPTAVEATAYSIVILAVSGILFGVMWARTKNLIALMLLHAAGDLLPNLAEFVNVWQIAK
jgi:membrane protease YdiL (CAAX protease family)